MSEKAAESEALAERLMSMTPEEILVKIRVLKVTTPDATNALDVLILAYREVCELRLEETLG